MNLDFFLQVASDVAKPVTMVIGNKCDLKNARVISTEQGKLFADGCSSKFMETSAKNDVNVTEVSNIVWCLFIMARQVV